MYPKIKLALKRRRSNQENVLLLFTRLVLSDWIAAVERNKYCERCIAILNYSAALGFFFSSVDAAVIGIAEKVISTVQKQRSKIHTAIRIVICSFWYLTSMSFHEIV